MCKGEEHKALSKVELILPANVVEACWNLKKNNQAFFFAVNENDKTSSEINIHKLLDSSVKIRVTVFPLEAPSDSQNEDEDLMSDQDTENSFVQPQIPVVLQSPVKGRAKKLRSDDESTPKRKRQRKSQQGKQDESMEATEESSPNKGANNIAATVKKMKSVLSPQKFNKDKANEVNPDDALIHVIQPEEVDDYLHDVDNDEFSPMASTIIIVKPSDAEQTTSPEPKASKKEVPRVHTVTMSSGKQIVYNKSKKGSKKAAIEPEKEGEAKETPEESTDVEEFLNELRDKKKKKGDEVVVKDDVPEETPKTKKRKTKNTKATKELSEDDEEKQGNTSLHQKWKSLGVEGEQLGSGDVLITAEDLKTATENFSVTFNDTEYNFEIQEKNPVSKSSTKLYSYSEKKPKLNIPIPVHKVQCMVCGKTLLNYSYLYRHVRHFHKDIQDVDQYLDEIRPLMKTPCPLCGKEISSISNMSSHIQQCHPATPEPYKCKECGGFYKTRISLKHHMQSQHTPGRKKFPCKYCGNLFTESRSLREHINCTHETTEVFSCEVCKKTFLTRGRLRRHMYIHGEFRLFCKYCGKGFHLKDNMNKHIDLMHEKKNPNRFKCEYCSKAFNVKGNLMQHINGVHLKTLPYRCPICDQGFRKKGHMLGHMKEHAVKKQEYDVVEDNDIDDQNESMESENEMEEEEEEEDIMNATV